MLSDRENEDFVRGLLSMRDDDEWLFRWDIFVVEFISSDLGFLLNFVYSSFLSLFLRK